MQANHMSGKDDETTIAKLQAKLKAQQKTIDVLMNTVELRTSEGSSSIELLSQNLSLERVIQQKTEKLQKQGEELKKTLQDLRLSQTQLLQAQKLESVGQLAAGIAHEINTPAQFISSNIDFLEDSFTKIKRLINAFQEILKLITQGTVTLEKGQESEDLLEELDWNYIEDEIPNAITETKEGLKRVTTIVQAMKEFSHPGSKEKAYYDLNKILETTITVARNEWRYCAEIVTHFETNLPQVCCLADEIGQVFLNLLINASHAIASTYRHNKHRLSRCPKRSNYYIHPSYHGSC